MPLIESPPQIFLLFALAPQLVPLCSKSLLTFEPQLLLPWSKSLRTFEPQFFPPLFQPFKIGIDSRLPFLPGRLFDLPFA